GAIAWLDLNQSFDPLPSNTPLQTGTYTVVQVINNCPSAFVDVDVTILPPVPAPTTVSSFGQFCEGADVSELATLASGVGTISWYDSELSTTPLNPSDELETGFYYVSQTVNGCESERVMYEAEVIPNPGAPVLVSEQTFCNTQNATVADLNTNGQPIAWHLGPASFDFLAGNTPLVDGTTYYAQLSVACAEDRTPVNVSFFSVDNTVTIANGTITANQQNATYEWYFCIDGFTSIGVTDPSFSPSDPSGAYAVVVTYQGCSATSDCIASSVVVGLDEAETNSFSAYPNPTEGVVQFSALVSGQLMDASGRRILDISNTMELDMTDLPQGLYILRTSEGTNLRLMKK
ncbi:MAG: T9SS type A sorting domain-containing protein, partial [Bacteroidetes bacterium]